MTDHQSIMFMLGVIGVTLSIISFTLLRIEKILKER